MLKAVNFKRVREPFEGIQQTDQFEKAKKQQKWTRRWMNELIENIRQIFA